MSVIIRLQNLPWSANALDIRQFFRGLSIPEGGVHIVGGEMGDAFIAFSTDEDARQAMMHDREAINGVQIRLLLSSRAEMQKVIETARQQSLLALKKASAAATGLNKPKALPPVAATKNVQKTEVATSPPQPPIITASSFQNILSNPTAAATTPSFLAYQQQAGFTLIPESNNANAAFPTKNSIDSDDDSDSHHSRQRRRSSSREHRRSSSRERRRSSSRSRERGVFRRRRERSRDRSRERDWSNGKRSSRHRSRSRARSRERSRERGERERGRLNSRDGTNNSRPRNMEADSKSKSNLPPWSVTNAYQASYNTNTETGQNSIIKMSNYQATFSGGLHSSDVSKPLGNGNSKSMDSLSSPIAGVSVTAISANFQNYNTANNTSLTALNNYSLSGILSASNSNDSFKAFALQNPYTTALNASENTTNTTSSSAIPGIFVEKKSDETNVQSANTNSANSLPQEPIAFANVNPYEQMYPNLFAQAAALNSGQKSGTTKQPSISDSPKAEESKGKEANLEESNCIKISNMCSRTSYSDLRKFFVGLFIPHNGIKLLNDKHGLRVGIAYVQFSRHSSVSKALCRNNSLLKGRWVIIEAVDEQEFLEAEDSFRPSNQDKSNSHSDNEYNEGGGGSQVNNSSSSSGFSTLNSYKKLVQLEPFTVLYIEDIPALATEQDIMKMFSSYSLYDILLIASPENRREFIAHVRFSREADAKSAYEDRAHHQIGYRRVRVRPGSIEEMENAKEKIRLANEQLIKEEQAAEEAEEAKRKLEKLIADHIDQEEKKQLEKQKNIISMDLTQEDVDDDDNDVIETTNELQNNDDGDMTQIDEEDRRNDIYYMRNQVNKFNTNLDPRRPQTPSIPSLFELDPMSSTNSIRNQQRTNLFNDPRLRNMSERMANVMDNNNKNNQSVPVGNNDNNFNNFNSNFNNQQEQLNPVVPIMNNMENNFVILKNCDYNARINDVAQLLLTANLALKHIEPLRNERQLPTGEFIVEFRRTIDAEIAVQRFHNIQFRNRSLRVFPITPQEIADRLGKPFLSYIPGGNGVRISKINLANLMNNTNNNNNNNRFGNNTTQNLNFRANNNPFSDNGPLNNDNNNNNNNERNNSKLNNSGNGNKNNGGGVGGGIPEKFTRPGCVLSLENVPYKAQISDILQFFQGFDLTPDDIIRRFNDDGSPTGDARVAFISPDQARAAFEAKKRKKLFGRGLFIKTI